jgi:hypothetical protein
LNIKSIAAVSGGLQTSLPYTVLWWTFSNRRNSAEVFGESKACSEVLEWNIDGLYILTTRAHSYFVNISILYTLLQLLLTVTYFLTLFNASKLKPRTWISRNPACNPIHDGRLIVGCSFCVKQQQIIVLSDRSPPEGAAHKLTFTFVMI